MKIGIIKEFKTPSDKRGESRLIVLNKQTGKMDHKMISDFPDLIEEGTLIVVNNNKFSGIIHRYDC